MKTIEEILEDLPTDDYGSGISEETCIKAMQAYAEQQVSIAVEKYYKETKKKLIKHGLKRNASILEIIKPLAPQILEELKGGDGDD